MNRYIIETEGNFSDGQILREDLNGTTLKVVGLHKNKSPNSDVGRVIIKDFDGSEIDVVHINPGGTFEYIVPKPRSQNSKRYELEQRKTEALERMASDNLLAESIAEEHVRRIVRDEINAIINRKY